MEQTEMLTKIEEIETKNDVNVKNETLSTEVKYSPEMENEVNITSASSGSRTKNSILLGQATMDRISLKLSKVFQCDHCPYTSENKHLITIHTRTHTGERPFKCIHCDYAAPHKTRLRDHMLIHMPSSEKRFRCEYCQFTTWHRVSMTSHVRTHTGEKPFGCHLCEYTASTRRNLRNHLEIHGVKLTLPRGKRSPMVANKVIRLDEMISADEVNCYNVTPRIVKIKSASDNSD